MSRKKQYNIDDNIWLRQPGETDKAFAAFQVYLDMGSERNISKVGQKLDKSRSQIDAWRVKYDWKNRAVAYDNYLISSKALKQKKEIEARYERFGRLSDQLAAFGISLLKTSDPSKLTHKEAIGYMQLALKFAQASREMFVMTAPEQIRTDIELLRIETAQTSSNVSNGTSNFEEAITSVASDIWKEYEEQEVKVNESDDNTE